ncbi:hypothetical protein K8I28_12675 [bacterium]|nr:hypothetical protein [bacterium]
MSIFRRLHPLILAFSLLVCYLNIYADEDHPGGDLVPAYADEWTPLQQIQELVYPWYGAVHARTIDAENIQIISGRTRWTDPHFMFYKIDSNGTIYHSRRTQQHEWQVNEVRHFVDSNNYIWLIIEGRMHGSRTAIKFNQDGDQPVGDGFTAVELERNKFGDNYILTHHPDGGFIYIAPDRPEPFEFGDQYYARYRHYSEDFETILDSVAIEFDQDIIGGYRGIRDIAGTIKDDIIHAILDVPFHLYNGVVSSHHFYTKLSLSCEILHEPQLMTLESDSIADLQLGPAISPVVDTQGNIYFISKYVTFGPTAVQLTALKNDGTYNSTIVSEVVGDFALTEDAFGNVHVVFRNNEEDDGISYTRLHNGDLSTMLPIQSLEIENEGIHLVDDLTLLPHPTRPQVDLIFLGEDEREPDHYRGIYRMQLLPAHNEQNQLETSLFLNQDGKFLPVKEDKVDVQSEPINYRIYDILGRFIQEYETTSIHDKAILSRKLKTQLPAGRYFLVSESYPVGKTISISIMK